MNTYQGWDVHSYTLQYRSFMETTGMQFTRPVEPNVWLKLIQELQSKYSHMSGAAVAITKMNARYNADLKGYFDADLQTSVGPCNVARLLLETWRVANTKNDVSVFSGFGEILDDIGNHCVQGDSHRLLNYYVCLIEYHTDHYTSPLLLDEEKQHAPLQQHVQLLPDRPVVAVDKPLVLKTHGFTDEELIAMKPPLPYHLALAREEAKARKLKNR